MNEEAETPDTLLLVDLSAIFRPVWESVPEREPADAARNITRHKIREMAAKYTHVAIAADGKGNWRHKVSPDYKGTRESAPPERAAQYQHLIDTLRGEGFVVWCLDGYEADDLIATACAQLRGKPLDVYIWTHDKDMFQLVGGNVFVQPLKRHGALEEPKPMGPKDVFDRFGVTPAQFGDYLALRGDASDNVKGIDGIGEKNGAALINRYGNLKTLFEQTKVADPAKKLTPAWVAKLQEGADRVMNVYRVLVSMKEDAPIDASEALKPRVMQPQPTAATPPPSEEEDEYMPNDNDSFDPGTGEVHEPAPAPQAAPSGAAGQQVAGKAEPQAQYAEAPMPPKRQEPAERIEGLMQFVKAGSDDWAAQLEPRSLKGAWELAVAMHNSRFFSAFGGVEQIYIAILRARSLGLGAVTGVSNMHPVKNKLTMGATIIAGMVLKHPVCEYFECVETTDQAATYIAKRVGRPETKFSYTLDEATKAGLTRGNGNWQTIPRTMLRHRCETELARMVFPDVTAGCYSPEEFE